MMSGIPGSARSSGLLKNLPPGSARDSLFDPFSIPGSARGSWYNTNQPLPNSARGSMNTFESGLTHALQQVEERRGSVESEGCDKKETEKSKAEGKLTSFSNSMEEKVENSEQSPTQ